MAEIGADGSKVYARRSTTSVKPKSEWIAVPVPDSGIPRELVDAARDAIKDNRPPASRKHRFWELAGGITRCGGCGKVMLTNTVTNRNRHYYRCRTRRDNGKEACEVTNRRADTLEAEAWQSVRAILSDPERLRADLDAMIEMKRHNLYKSLRIGVLAHADGSTEIILGNLLELRRSLYNGNDIQRTTASNGR